MITYHIFREVRNTKTLK